MSNFSYFYFSHKHDKIICCGGIRQNRFGFLIKGYKQKMILQRTEKIIQNFSRYLVKREPRHEKICGFFSDAKTKTQLPRS